MKGVKAEAVIQARKRQPPPRSYQDLVSRVRTNTNLAVSLSWVKFVCKREGLPINDNKSSEDEALEPSQAERMILDNERSQEELIAERLKNQVCENVAHMATDDTEEMVEILIEQKLQPTNIPLIRQALLDISADESVVEEFDAQVAYAHFAVFGGKAKPPIFEDGDDRRRGKSSNYNKQTHAAATNSWLQWVKNVALNYYSNWWDGGLPEKLDEAKEAPSENSSMEALNKGLQSLVSGIEEMLDAKGDTDETGKSEIDESMERTRKTLQDLLRINFYDPLTVDDDVELSNPINRVQELVYNQTDEYNIPGGVWDFEQMENRAERFVCQQIEFVQQALPITAAALWVYHFFDIPPQDVANLFLGVSDEIMAMAEKSTIILPEGTDADAIF